ncbi:MAG: hypothetical protein ACRBCI_14385 [Cellvibrionaceae bacterium]
MGIVVTVFMLLGLLVLSPLPLLKAKKNNQLIYYIAYGLLLMGLWNFLWFGLRHLSIFWGIAAVVSGVFMVLASIIILVESNEPRLAENALVKSLYTMVKPLKLWVVTLLLASFLLYAITLIQLNLGYPIIS